MLQFRMLHASFLYLAELHSMIDAYVIVHMLTGCLAG